MPQIMVSFDDVPRSKTNASMSSYPDHIETSFSNKSSRAAPLVKPPDKVVKYQRANFSEKFKNVHKDKLLEYMYSCELEGPRVKFLTIRPHDEFMYGKYNIKTRSECLRIFTKEIKENIPYPFIGSIESNNSIFLHTHLIIICTNAQLNILHQRLRDLFTVQHLISNRQYAVMKQRPKSPADRLFMIRYYLGLKYNAEKKQFFTKPSYLTNIISEWPLREIDPILQKEFKELFDNFLHSKYI